MENYTFHNINRLARLFTRYIILYGHFGSKKRQLFKLDILKTIFKVTNNYLNHLGIDYWIVDGTLLGYHRIKDILKHDTDIDIGVHESAYQVIWQNRNKLPNGFKMYNTSKKHRGPKLYISYKGWEADIYFFEDQGNLLQSYATGRMSGEYLPFPKEYIYPIQKARFLDESTCVPNQVVPYLEHVYGYIGEDAIQDKKTGYWYKVK